jgi:hypothetical protein
MKILLSHNKTSNRNLNRARQNSIQINILALSAFYLKKSLLALFKPIEYDFHETVMENYAKQAARQINRIINTV